MTVNCSLKLQSHRIFFNTALPWFIPNPRNQNRSGTYNLLISLLATTVLVTEEPRAESFQYVNKTAAKNQCDIY